MDCNGFPKFEDLNKYQDFIIRGRYPDFYKYVKENVVGRNWVEKLYCYYHNINELPVCKVCGRPVGFINMNDGFRTYCCRQCCFKDKDWVITRDETVAKKYGCSNVFSSDKIKEKIKQTCLEKYGVDNPNKNKVLHRKAEDTCLKKYGVRNPFSSDKIKEKIKQTCIERYGFDNPIKNKEIRQKAENTCLEKYGTRNVSDREWVKMKVKETKSKRKNFNTSKIEHEFKHWLDENKINYIYQYRDPIRYPFNCDFYFPDKDIFLEIQGMWLHGFHPFNPNDEKDMETLNKWKDKSTVFYDTAINTWTVSDPLKRQTAKDNNLYWLEIFTANVDELIEFIKPHIK